MYLRGAVQKYRFLSHTAPVLLALVILLILPINSSYQLQANQISSGEGKWLTISTPHFRIHFREEFHNFAIELGRLFENVHERLRVKYDNDDRITQVTLIFSTDTENAFASVYGHDHIVLYLNKPAPSEFAMQTNRSERVFVHEYTHILSLRYEPPGGLQTPIFKFLFGIRPNILTPKGMIEGMAVHEESRGGEGREDHPSTRMLLRTIINSDRFPEPGEIMAGSHRWPGGRMPYLYGGRLMKYISENYYKDAVYEFWKTGGTLPFFEILPFFLNARLFAVTGHDYQRIYKDFRATEYKRFQTEIAELSRQKFTPFERLSNDGMVKGFMYMNQQQELIYFAIPPNRASGVYSWPVGAKEPQLLRRVNSTRGLAEGGGRRIFSEDYHVFPGFGLQIELFDGDSRYFNRRLLPGVKAAFPALTPDGKTIFYVERSGLKRRLVRRAVLEDGLSEEESIVLQAPQGGGMGHTAMAPNGKQLALVYSTGDRAGTHLVLCDIAATAPAVAASKEPAGGADLKTQLDNSNCVAHLKNVASASLTDLAFTHDGRSIYFTSDASGVYNIYRFDLAQKKVERVTHVLTGLSSPAPGRERLYAFAYFEDGDDLVAINYKDLKSEKTDDFTVTQIKIEPGVTVDGGVDAVAKRAALPEGWSEERYSGPLQVTPFFSGIMYNGPDQFTLALNAFDPMYRHRLLAGLSYAVPDPYIFAFYNYTRYSLGANLTYLSNYRKDRRGAVCHYRDKDWRLRHLCGWRRVLSETARGSLFHIWQGRTFFQQIQLGLLHNKLRNVDLTGEYADGVNDLNLSGANLSYYFDRTRSYPTSISPEHGFRLSLKSNYYSRKVSKLELDPGRTRPVEFGVAEGGLALYLPGLFDNHVNYLNGYIVGSYGPDRNIKLMRLNRLVRGINYTRSPIDQIATVLTYEYRLPLLWHSKAVIFDEVMLRSVSMGLFTDYGVAYEKKPYRSDWVQSFGVTISLGVNLFYLPTPTVRFTLARGRGESGETQFYFSFSLPNWAGSISSDSYYKSPLATPINEPLPRSTDVPGYFRDPLSGGILE